MANTEHDDSKAARHKKDAIKGPQSLLISPNLDALLDFDEKSRRAGPASPAPERKELSVLTSPAGLPPPPRSRNPWSPISPTSSSSLEGPTIKPMPSVKLSMPNPYINPAPVLNVPTRRDAAERDDMIPRDGPPETGDGGKAPLGGDQIVDLQPSNVCLPSATFVTTKKRVDKLLSIGKIPFGRFSESKPESNNNLSSSKPPLSPVLNLRERARANSKLLNMKDTSNGKSETFGDLSAWLNGKP